MIRAAVLPLLALALAAGACSSGGGNATSDTTTPTIGAAPGDTGGVAPAPAAASPANGLLDPNTATREELAVLPGMTPALADSIVARRPHADMLAVDAILKGSLSEAQRDTIYTRLFKPLALNTASRDEIELIPRVGRRMSHEFEEYRPYGDIARFRREIGKYVDSTEVARLEKYVRIQ